MKDNVLIARAKLSRIDLSQLPFKMEVSLVKCRNISDSLRSTFAADNYAFAIKLVAYVKERDTKEYRPYVTFVGVDFSIDTEYLVLNLIRFFADHEILENYYYNNIRLIDPHN